MALTRITTTQNQFLESYLRGTGRSLSSQQAKSLFGVQNLRARCTEMRKAGLKVQTKTNGAGRTMYAVSARTVNGSRAKVFA